MISLPPLYCIADATFGNPVILARALFDGGARLVQVRNKRDPVRILLQQVEEILRFVPANGRLLVNDRADVALLAQAGGVHLGQTDLNAAQARKILPAHQIIGLSTHNLAQARQAPEMVDYIAAGPVFPTSTKSDAEPVIGLQGLREICVDATRPVVAIGGITLENASAVFACGVSSVAVISDLLKASDVARRTAEWMRYNLEACRNP